MGDIAEKIQDYQKAQNAYVQKNMTVTIVSTVKSSFKHIFYLMITKIYFFKRIVLVQKIFNYNA